jgi:hypothetical protein
MSINVTSETNSTVTATFQEKSGQTADILQVLAGGGSLLCNIDSSGNIKNQGGNFTHIGGAGTPPRQIIWDYSTATGDDNQPVVMLKDASGSANQPRFYITSTGGVRFDNSLVVGQVRAGTPGTSTYRICGPLGQVLGDYINGNLAVTNDVDWPAFELKVDGNTNNHFQIGYDPSLNIKVSDRFRW